MGILSRKKKKKSSKRTKVQGRKKEKQKQPSKIMGFLRKKKKPSEVMKVQNKKEEKQKQPSKIMGFLSGKKQKKTSVNDSILQLSKNIGELKANFEEMQRKQTEVEIISKKTSALLEVLKPDFIIKIKNQDISINSLKLELDSIKKLEETFINEIKNLKRKLEFFDYQRVVEMDKETHIKLRNIERLNALTEKNSQKVESLFMEIEKQYVEFKKFKALGDRLENSFIMYVEKFNKFREESDKYLKEDDLSPLKKDIEKLKKAVNKSSKKKVVKGDKKKKKRFKWIFSKIWGSGKK
ncbi:hypothetical protein KY342_07040 [Candidatus Woesearchaeota archaeon]|nr:hypothetical protein [Candidatus Woesearchaeota archaeon]